VVSVVGTLGTFVSVLAVVASGLVWANASTGRDVAMNNIKKPMVMPFFITSPPRLCDMFMVFVVIFYANDSGKNRPRAGYTKIF